ISGDCSLLAGPWFNPFPRQRYTALRSARRDRVDVILVAVVRLAVSGLVEEVVGRVRHKRQMPDVCWRTTARRRCNPSRGVQPLDEGGLRQSVTTGGSVFGFSHRNLEPGNGIRRDESEVGGGIACLHEAPDGARVPGVLPRDANRANGHHRWIRVVL